jgi:hypothetical protein
MYVCIYAQLTVRHLHKIVNTPGYKGHMERTHIHTISSTYNQWPTKSITSRGSSPPTLKCVVRTQRDTGTLVHHTPYPSPTPSLPHSAPTSPAKTTLSSPHSATMPLTSPTHTPTKKGMSTAPPHTQVPSLPPHPPLA